MKKQKQIKNVSRNKRQRLGFNRQRRPAGPKAAVSEGVLNTRGGVGWGGAGRAGGNSHGIIVDVERLTCNVISTCNHAATIIGLLCFLRWLCCFAYFASLI